MSNLILFINSFLSYVLVFAVVVVVAFVGGFCGVKWKNASDKKAMLAADEDKDK